MASKIIYRNLKFLKMLNNAKTREEGTSLLGQMKLLCLNYCSRIKYYYNQHINMSIDYVVLLYCIVRND